MNANRRKQIAEAAKLIEQAHDLILAASEQLEDVRTDEEDAFDNLPDSLQETDRGEAMQEAIDNLQEAIDELENFDFDAVYDYLDEAKA